MPQGCSRQFKVTNSKANHNEACDVTIRCYGVPDSSKLQIQKQITTNHPQWYSPIRCSRQFKVTNSKANHNIFEINPTSSTGVPDSSKLQIQKQITTKENLQPDHRRVFPIVQSYKFKSKSQPRMGSSNLISWCSRQFKVTNSKANHNNKRTR